MYNLEDIRTLHLEITSKCQAACPMCGRNLQGGIDTPFMTISEITIDKFKNWLPIEFIKQLDRLYMCGNLGDPIMASDTLEIFSYIRNNNKTIHLSMNTNGSARNAVWWQSLAKLNVSVRFGIDGLEDTHSIYRINTDYKKIIENAKSFIDAGGYAIWDMLVFDHNKHQVVDCKNLSIELGFKEFFSKNTSRFNNSVLTVLDKEGRTRYTIQATDRSVELSNNIVQASGSCHTISCKAKEQASIYISATGNVVPCCWLDLQWRAPTYFNRINYMDNIGKWYNLNNIPLADIFNSGIFQKIESTWETTSLLECSKQCGIFDKFGEQFTKL
jgi:MoaA/NifB/PqqE/SkfB family radical SAM enzyme